MSEREPAYYAIIPASVRYDASVCPNAKLLYGELTALSHKEGYCWATNEYFSKLYGASKRSISEWVSQLMKAGYIHLDVKQVGNGYSRKIYITELPKSNGLPREENFHTPTKLDDGPPSPLAVSLGLIGRVYGPEEEFGSASTPTKKSSIPQEENFVGPTKKSSTPHEENFHKVIHNNNTLNTTTTTEAAGSGDGFKQSITSIGDISWFIRAQWGASGNIGNDKFFGPEGLNAIGKAIGLEEMQKCIEIVGEMEPKSRSIRCLKGVINNRAADRLKAAAPPVDSSKPKQVDILCEHCETHAFVPMDDLLANKGKSITCGECNSRQSVDKILESI